MEIIFENARNGMLTCKYNFQGNWKYLYSKYEPQNVKIDFIEDQKAPYVLIVGLGLGYEVLKIREQTSKKMIIIESDRRFEQYVSTKLDNCELIYLDELGDNFTINKNAQIWVNLDLIKLNKGAYQNFLTKILHYKQRKKIWVIKNPFLVKSCIRIFSKMGYEVEEIDSELLKVKTYNENTKPDFVFGLGYSIGLAQALHDQKITYISWLIDSPQFQLELENAFDYANSYIFSFDYGLVQMFNKNRQKNMYYMPLAADIEKFDSLTLLKLDGKKYYSDAVFIGDSGRANKFLELAIDQIIEEPLLSKLNYYIKLQRNENHYVLRDYITNQDYDAFMENYKQLGKKEITNYIKIKRQFEYILANQASHLNRKELVYALESINNFNVYGDIGWLDILENPMCYKGIAEYGEEVYKIMKSSKININDTRLFFEDAIPLRIFETLGTGAFCVTNDRKSKVPLFKNGRDLVVYRDMQDLREIIDYYLHHEKEREEIALNGYSNIHENHTLKNRLEEIMKIVHREV